MTITHERIARRIARAGVASRRSAEAMIAAGRVAVNGQLLDSPACVVSPSDEILIDGQPLPTAEATRLWRYHKPVGLLTTHHDPQGRATLFERLPPGLPRLISVGRLDMTSEGLLLLTNDGALARHLELPGESGGAGWLRRYRVRAFGEIDPDRLAGLAGGITVEGIRYGPIEATLERRQGDNLWLSMTLREGRNREIRRVLEALGLKVNRLIRTAYGPFQLGKLEAGGLGEVTGKVLREQVPAFAPPPSQHRR